MDPLYIVPVIVGYLLYLGMTNDHLSVRALFFPVTGLIIVWLSATPLVSNSLIGALESRHTSDDNCNNVELLVVLAGGIKGRARSESDFLRLRDASLRRAIATASWLAEHPGVPAILIGGYGGQATEAAIMGQLIKTVGIENTLTVLDEPKNTKESASAVAAHPKAQNRKIAVLTSAYHMPRAWSEFNAVGIDPCALPTDFHRARIGGLGSLVPNTQALRKTILSCHEFLGMLLG
jgi:uncharacterized SAM-binding protein YcdF (DUF218 family)